MSLESSLEKLQVDNPDLEILRNAEKQLKNGPSDGAELTRLVALIKLERYSRAYELVKKNPAKFPTETSYILYKLGKLEQLRTLAAESDVPAVHLALAQAEYRIGNFSVAEHILDKVTVDDEDIPTNIQAIRASRGLNVEGTSFEALFAKAYSLLYRAPEQALAVLSDAKQVAGDEYDQQCVLIQAAFAQALAGRASEAEELLEQLLSSNCDKDLILLVKNNLLTFKSVPETAEQCQLTLLSHFSEPLPNATSIQASAFVFNKLLLDSRAGRKIGYIANQHAELYPTSLAPQLLALQTRPRKQLLKELSRDPTNVALALAVAAQSSTLEAANVVIDLCSTLAATNTTKDLTPALAGLVVAAYRIKGQPEKIATMLRIFPLKDAETARYLALSENQQDVQKAFEFFAHNCDGHTEKAAGLLLTKPESFEAPESIPSVAELVRDIDVEDLESQGMYPLVPRRKITSQPTIRKKRSGKPKLPKEYDPARQPDPERWLPKMDRSTYKKKKKGNSQGTSQGAAQGASSAPTPAAPVLQAPSKKTKNNKKKKGGKK